MSFFSEKSGTHCDFISSMYLQFTCKNATSDSQDTWQLSEAFSVALQLPLKQN